jgi:hypothetical protein
MDTTAAWPIYTRYRQVSAVIKGYWSRSEII